ncbi:MAG: SAM-dependent methyltransferase, partial [Actinomycetota bacterium]|nr:SAM-dependent methyltransferase [Actinomycetota bacterium]
MTSSDLWDEQTAARYDDSSAHMFMPDVLDPTVAF